MIKRDWCTIKDRSAIRVDLKVSKLFITLVSRLEDVSQKLGSKLIIVNKHLRELLTDSDSAPQMRGGGRGGAVTFHSRGEEEEEEESFREVKIAREDDPYHKPIIRAIQDVRCNERLLTERCINKYNNRLNAGRESGVSGFGAINKSSDRVECNVL